MILDVDYNINGESIHISVKQEDDIFVARGSLNEDVILEAEGRTPSEAINSLCELCRQELTKLLDQIDENEADDKDEIDEKDMNFDELLGEYHLLEDDYNILSNDYEELCARFQKLQKDYKHLNKDYDILNDKYLELANDSDKCEKLVDHHQKEIAMLTKQLNDMDIEFDEVTEDLLDTIDNLCENYVHLYNQHQELKERQNNKLNSKDFPTEMFVAPKDFLWLLDYLNKF